MNVGWLISTTLQTHRIFSMGLLRNTLPFNLCFYLLKAFLQITYIWTIHYSLKLSLSLSLTHTHTQMDAKFLSHSRSPFSTLSHRRHTCKPACTPIHAVLTRPSPNITQEARKTSVYNDRWFDLIAINHLSQSVQAATGSFLLYM